MTKPAASIKTQAGRSWNLSHIVKQTARVVAYLLALVVASAAMASCQDWHRQHAFDCNAQPEQCL